MVILEQWQTLAGAFLGGVFALFVALLVAWNVRRRDEETGAMLLTAELKPFEVAVSVLNEIVSAENSQVDQLLSMSARLYRVRPHLSPLFDSSMARVMTVDTYLAAYLTLFRHRVRTAEQIFSRIESAEEQIHSGQVSGRARYELRDSLRMSAKQLILAAEFAERALPLLECLFTGPFPTFRRLFRQIWKPASEKQFLLMRDQRHDTPN